MNSLLQSWKEELVACVKFLYGKGYAPATSSNYSFRLPGKENIQISASGIDKGQFGLEHIMDVDLQGRALDANRRPSAETLLHTLIYAQQAEVTCVLHTHTVYNTTLSLLFAARENLRLEGFEVLKGLSGISTHEAAVDIPIFANSQDMPALAAEIKRYWESHPDMRGFLLVGHGFYTWGASIAAAKRHIEVFEFLFECFYKIHIFEASQKIS